MAYAPMFTTLLLWLLPKSSSLSAHWLIILRRSASRAGCVVGCSSLIPVCVRQLEFDDQGVPAHFVQLTRCHAPEAVRGHLILAVIHASKCGRDGVLGHWTFC